MDILHGYLCIQGIKGHMLRCGRAAVFLGILIGLSGPVQATNHIVQINEIMAGLNGDSRIQFVEMESSGNFQKAWGPQFGEIVGRVMLVFFDADGNQTGRFVVPSDPPFGKDTVLFATETFANLTSTMPDFLIPEGLIHPIAGKVCFKDNPDNTGPHFPISLCLSYGGAGFTGDVEGGGAAHPDDLPILNSQSLSRVNGHVFAFSNGTQSNADS